MSVIAPALIGRFFNAPLLLDLHADLVTAALADPRGSLLAAHAELKATLGEVEVYGDDKGYDVVSGIALVPISGVLVQELGCVREWWGITGYDGIRTAFFAALADPDVRAIALVICSPGGDVSGLFDLAEDIFASRGEKPIWAILDEYAYSAGYALASAAERILVPRTGGTGSIGVIAMHVELTAMLDEAGITVTVLRRGEHKAEVNSVEKLTSGARDRWQADIDVIGEMFEEMVARNRGIAVADIVAMKAETFLGAEGVRLGLADAVMAPAAAFDALLGAIT